jgi:cellobiose phosphorylase
LRDAITGLIAAGGDTIRLDQPGGIFVRLAASIVDADRILLQSVARVVLSDRDGPLAEQLARRDGVAARPPHSPHPPRPPTSAAGSHAPESLAATAAWANDLLFPNGLGGFSPDGREYVISVSPDRMTPVPWVNILANPSFGTLISESGSANTWSENAQEFRLTPWANDPVSDANAEAYYLRDEESGRFWPATLLPRVPGQCRAAGGAAAPYVTRHGFGYSVFEHSEDGIESVLTVFVAIDAPVKFALLTLRNCTRRARRLSVTGYVEWVLGDEPAKTRMHVITELDAGSGAVFARNAYNTDFAGRTAFFDVTNAGKPGAIGDLRDGNVVDMAGDAAAADGAAAGSAQRSWSGDRLAFVGPNGTLGNPAGMSRPGLSGTVGAALDPCAAIRIPCGLAAGQTCEIVFRLGAEHSAGAARDLLQRSHGAGAAHEALASVKHYWQRTLGAVQVRTPDPSLDVLANGWLVYQVLASRLWARNALYQSSGAFGFRDQLQDVMALVHAAPALVREHLLRSAGRQFPEGDVQHWWHPPSGRGVRTHCSDDYLWLPLATCRYVRCTGDTGVLDESLHFIHGSAPKAGEESSYGPATGSPEVADLYGHCVRAIGHGLVFGAHGLPLMGSCDWNDGMNLVGAGGKGESVWLGFFLYTVLTQFGELAQRRGDAAFATRCASEGARLREAIEHCAWDGDWYLRAWFDDGSPLGSAKNTECRIDSIAQSWSVLSGAGAAERACQAMVALDRHLVCPDGALIQLLDPPFDKSEPNPGYIKGYLPGVRENGGQYTHAAVWAAMAFAELGDAERAWKLFAMLNPVNHANSAESIAVYKTEPYVIAADVYSRAPHVGRGGWTWYTGSAGWMYRFILEALLGLRREADALHFAPCLPADWTSFEVHYRYRETVYHIVVLQTGRGDAGTKLTVDGLEQSRPVVPLVDDRRPHTVELIIRRQSRPGQER